jgi:hypothetical protein
MLKTEEARKTSNTARDDEHEDRRPSSKPQRTIPRNTGSIFRKF